MNDFKPMPKPQSQPPRPVQPPTVPETERIAPIPLPIMTTSPGLQPKKDRKKLKKIILFSVLGLLTLLIGFVAAAFIWYNSQLAAVDEGNSELVTVTIKENTSPKEIASVLKEEGVIRNTQAFSIYTRITNTQNTLKAGKYRLSPSETTPEIVNHLTKGTVDTFNITFLPGATLAENRDVLIKAGYSEAQVDAALAGTYESTLFEGKPTGGDLEGFIYGETYNISSSASVEDILVRVFTEFESVVEKNGLVAKFKAQGLSLYQGITLASIVQRESIGGDEADIAQVFYNRLANGTMLGSDVTYQYAADKMGVPRDTNLDSPYNTRRYTGLPPGPISAPGLNSLLGVANPSGHDYLFFLSGDDDITYFATDFAGHEANIKSHCKVKCTIL